MTTESRAGIPQPDLVLEAAFNDLGAQIDAQFQDDAIKTGKEIGKHIAFVSIASAIIAGGGSLLEHTDAKAAELITQTINHLPKNVKEAVFDNVNGPQTLRFAGGIIGALVGFAKEVKEDKSLKNWPEIGYNIAAGWTFGYKIVAGLQSAYGVDMKVTPDEYLKYDAIPSTITAGGGVFVISSNFYNRIKNGVKAKFAENEADRRDYEIQQDINNYHNKIGQVRLPVQQRLEAKGVILSGRNKQGESLFVDEEHNTGYIKGRDGIRKRNLND